MDAKRCDRCGEFYNSYDNGKLAYNIFNAGRYHYDLCKECYKKLQNFMTELNYGEAQEE